MMYSIVMKGCILLCACTTAAPAAPVLNAAAAVTPPDIVHEAVGWASTDTFLVLEAFAVDVPEKAVLREPEYSLPLLLDGALYLYAGCVTVWLSAGVEAVIVSA